MEDSGLRWEEAVERCAGHLNSTGIPLSDSPFLLAVSGGMDSMCMLALFASMRVRFIVAHVNYGLRGSESDADADMVREICAQRGVGFYVHELDLRAAVNSGEESLQQAGRRIRYDWFEQLRLSQNCDYICTAHHQDDNAETFFVNVLRGTGLQGLTGIPLIRDRIIRPLLCFTRAEISHLVRQEHLVYRDDASNFGRNYLRNRIRHDVIPFFKAERPAFIRRMYATQQRLREEYMLLEDILQRQKESICTQLKDVVILDQVVLQKCVSPAVVLYFILKEYGFSWSQCTSIVSRPHRSGARFLTSTHTLIFDRLHMRVSSIRGREDLVIGTAREGQLLLPEGELSLSRMEKMPVFTADPNIEYIDAAKLKDDLYIRHWREGDFFYPLGMRGRQKLQDFFTNQKISLAEKGNRWILTDGDAVVWIVGLRLDDRYKITTDTRNVMKMEWMPVDS